MNVPSFSYQRVKLFKSKCWPGRACMHSIVHLAQQHSTHKQPQFASAGPEGCASLVRRGLCGA